jgi:mono/diheme cytochrome c family protein
MKRIVTLILVVSAAAAASITAISGSASANGATVYSQNCVKCHGAGGKGVENFTPDLSKSNNEAAWPTVVSKGRGAMPSFRDSLSSAQINAVLRHVRTFKMARKN